MIIVLLINSYAAIILYGGNYMQRNKPKKTKLPSRQTKQLAEKIIFVLGMIYTITGIMVNIHNMLK